MADTTHNVTIKATLDTSSISGYGSSGGTTSSSNSASTLAGGAQIAGAGAQIAGASAIIQSFSQLKTSILGFAGVLKQLDIQTRTLHNGFSLLYGKLTEISFSVGKVNSLYLAAAQETQKISAAFADLQNVIDMASKVNEGLINQMFINGKAVENATAATQEETRAKKENAAATKAQTNAAKESVASLQSLIGGLGISQVGSAAERLFEATGNKGLSRGIGAATTIGTMAAGGTALGSVVPGLGNGIGAAIGAAAGAATAALNWMSSAIKDLDDEVRRAQAETQMYIEAFKKMGAAIKEARSTRYQYQQEDQIKKAGDSLIELNALSQKYANSIESYKKQIRALNDEIASGTVTWGIEDLKNQINELNAKLQIEQNLQGQVAQQIENVNKAAEDFKRAMDEMYDTFHNAIESYDKLIASEQQQRILNKIPNKGLQSLFEGEYTNRAQAGEYESKVAYYDNLIEGVISRFDYALPDQKKELNEQLDRFRKERDAYKELQDSSMALAEAFQKQAQSIMSGAEQAKNKLDEFQKKLDEKSFTESLKATSKENLKVMAESLQRQIKEQQNQIAYNFKQAGGKDINKALQDSYMKSAEDTMKEYDRLSQRLKAVQDAMKPEENTLKLDDPSSVMTDLGKMGAYMSKQEMQLQDPQLSKLDEISKTLFDIRTNTRNNVSKFL